MLLPACNASLKVVWVEWLACLKMGGARTVGVRVDQRLLGVLSVGVEQDGQDHRHLRGA